MQLKKSIDIQMFLNDVLKCHGGIYYSTTEGDHLNLKSQLSQFVFLLVFIKKNDLISGEISISDPNDLMVLDKYIELM